MVALAHPLVELKEGSTVKQTNQYDGLNRRIVRDETGGSGVLKHFYYNEQWQVLEERKEVSGTIDPDPLAQYVYHPHYIDAVAIRYYDSNTDNVGIRKDYYLYDANFNVTALIVDNGSVVERYHYSPYGEVTILNPNFAKDSNQKSDIGNEILYTGRRLDPETGLQLNRNRFYHARLGRWVNRDPDGYVDSNSLFEYVASDPLSMTDPSGLNCEVHYICRLIGSTVTKVGRRCIYACNEDITKPRKPTVGGTILCNDPLIPTSYIDRNSVSTWRWCSCPATQPNITKKWDTWGRIKNCSQKKCTADAVAAAKKQKKGCKFFPKAARAPCKAFWTAWEISVVSFCGNCKNL